MNFKLETIGILERHGLSWKDVEFIQGSTCRIADKDSFLELMDFEYYNGFGGTEIPEDMVIVGKDWWLERHEYDGSEWWEFKTLPKPEEIVIEAYSFNTSNYPYSDKFNKCINDYSEDNDE